MEAKGIDHFPIESAQAAVEKAAANAQGAPSFNCIIGRLAQTKKALFPLSDRATVKPVQLGTRTKVAKSPLQKAIHSMAPGESPDILSQVRAKFRVLHPNEICR